MDLTTMKPSPGNALERATGREDMSEGTTTMTTTDFQPIDSALVA